jgi:hypothetical protein
LAYHLLSLATGERCAMNDFPPKKLNGDYCNVMPYEGVVESLRDSNSFRNLVRDILLEYIKSQDVQKAFTDSLRDYAPFHNFIAESVAESKQKSTGKFFSRFSNFSLEQLVSCTILCTVTFLLGHLYSPRETSNRSDSISLVQSSKRETPPVSDKVVDPKLEKNSNVFRDQAH